MIFDVFDKKISDFIRSVDSLFIASQYNGGDDNVNRGVDSSHRVGMSGVFRVADARTVLISDYIREQLF